MVDGAPAPPGPPPVKRKRGRPRKADVLAAAAAAGGAASGAGPLVLSNVNGVPSSSLVPKPEPKQRKPRKKSDLTGSFSMDAGLVGKTVTGVLDGSFDAGYLLTVRVGDSSSVLRGVVFGPGLTVPLTKSNDIAPGVQVVKRDENVAMPAVAPAPVLGATSGANSSAGYVSQGPPVIQAPAAPVAAATAKPSPLPIDPSSQASRGQDSGQASVAAIPAGTAAS